MEVKAILKAVYQSFTAIEVLVEFEAEGMPAVMRSYTYHDPDKLSPENINPWILAEAERIESLLDAANVYDSIGQDFFVVFEKDSECECLLKSVVKNYDAITMNFDLKTKDDMVKMSKTYTLTSAEELSSSNVIALLEREEMEMIKMRDRINTVKRLVNVDLVKFVRGE